ETARKDQQGRADGGETHDPSIPRAGEAAEKSIRDPPVPAILDLASGCRGRLCMRAAILAICLLLEPGLQAEKPGRVALDAKVDLKVPAGSLDAALDAIEKQAGVRFAVL